MKIAVFVSGSGTNLQALINAQSKGELSHGEISLVVSDKPESHAIERAEKAGIETFAIKKEDYSSREEFDKEIEKKLEVSGIELVVLAGYMRLLSDPFVDKYEGKIINIHPALLPSFKGTHGIKDAFEYGVKITGVTVHFVDKELDNGPIILQKEVSVEADDTLETLEEKIHAEEHKLYPEALRLYVEGKLETEGRKVKINR